MTKLKLLTQRYISFFMLSLITTASPVAVSATVPLMSPQRSSSIVAQSNLVQPDWSDVGRPRRRRGGGSRGTCLVADKPPLTALIAETGTGYTVSPSPSFWFYLPYRLTDRHTLEFIVKDSQENQVYAQTIRGDQTAPGLINLRLPAAVVLDTTQPYEWYLLVQCDAENAERFVFVNGAVRRLEPSAQSPSNPTSADQTEFYSRQQIWYDAIDTVATQLQANPANSNTRQQWRSLLQSLDLAELAEEPIVACCASEP